METILSVVILGALGIAVLFVVAYAVVAFLLSNDEE